MEQELKGKVAIVTGAGRMRSIGRPIAKLLAQAGAAVVITGTGRPPERYPDDEKAAGWHDIESVAGEILGAGGRCLTLISDVCDEQANDALIERAVAEFGRLDILINNASAARGPDRVPTLEMPYAVWKKVMVTNLDGTFLLSRAAARRMIAQGGGGSIVNISSIASKLAPANARRVRIFEGRRQRAQPFDGARARQAQHPRQCRMPRRHRHLPNGRLGPRRHVEEFREDYDSVRLHGRRHRMRRDDSFSRKRPRQMDHRASNQRRWRLCLGQLKETPQMTDVASSKEEQKGATTMAPARWTLRPSSRIRLSNLGGL
jgi:NAD(P)-dependent dehydrogenase (short-subunit alcohol dehydrogenase family)